MKEIQEIEKSENESLHYEKNPYNDSSQALYFVAMLCDSIARNDETTFLKFIRKCNDIKLHEEDYDLA